MSEAPRIIEILFKEEGHEYTVNGRKSDCSVTELIGKQIDKTEWFGVPSDVLKRAADRGTFVHKDLELMVRDGRPPETQEAKNFAAWLTTQKLENPKTEFKLAIEHHGLLLTGTADFIATLNLFSTLADYKTTSVIHHETVRWQLSLLDYMARKCNGAIINGVLLEYTPAEKFFVFHFDKEGVFTPVELTKISDIEIERLLDAEADGKEYHPSTFITPRLQADVVAVQTQIAQHQLALKALEAQDTALKTSLLTAFEANPDIKSVECPEFKITYVAPTVTTSFDSKGFEAAFPEEAKKWRKTSSKKGYVLITLRDATAQNSAIPASLPTQSASPSTQSGLPSLPPAPAKRKKAKKDYFGSEV